MPEPVGIPAAAPGGVAVADAPSAIPSNEFGASPEEQILGYDEHSSDIAPGLDPGTEVKPPAGQVTEVKADEIPAKTEGEAKPEGEKPAGAPDAVEPGTLDLRRVPESIREAVKASPELSAAFLSHLALADAGVTPAEIAELKANFPEGVAQINAQREELTSYKATDDALMSGTPEQRTEAARSVIESIGAEAPNLLRYLGNALATKDAPAWNTFAQEVLTSTLKADGWEEFIKTADSVLEAKDGAKALTALAEVVKYGRTQGKLAPTEKEQLQTLRSTLEQREVAQHTEARNSEIKQFETFNTSLAAEADKGIDVAVDTQLAKLLPATFPDGLKAQVRKVIITDLREAFTSDAAMNQRIVAHVQSLINPGGPKAKDHKGAIGLKLSPAELKSATDFILSERTPLVAKILAKVMPDWVNNFTAKQQEKDKKQAAQNKPDITGASVAGRPQQKLTPKNIDYRRTSDEQILGM